jgi:hypothetical protein
MALSSPQLSLTPFSRLTQFNTCSCYTFITNTSQTVTSRQIIRIPNNNNFSLSLTKQQPTPSSFLITASSTKTHPMLPPYNVLITGSTKGLLF